MSLTTSLLRDDRRSIYGAIATFVDLTPIKRAEEHAQRLDRLAALGRFTSSVAHEIRNPLTGIGAGVQYLARALGERRAAAREPRVHPERDQAASTASSRTCSTSRTRAGSSLRVAPVEDTLQARRRSASTRCTSERGVRVELELDARARRRCRTTADQIEQVFINLVKNALEASPRRVHASHRGRGRVGGGPRWHAAPRDARRVAIRVDGPGASGSAPDQSEDACSRPFFTTEARRDRARTLHQPRHRQAPWRQPDRARASPAGAPRSRWSCRWKQRRIAMSKANILVVDDQDSIRHFREQGARGRRASPSQRRARCARRARSIERDMPDLAILDLKLPDGTGLELLREIKRTQPEVPVIMMTAFGELETAVEAMSAGAFWFVKKPFQNEELLALVDRALESQKLWIELRRLRHQRVRRRGLPRTRRAPRCRRPTRSPSRCARGDTTSVLIEGESGTGKEYFANLIHRMSARARQAVRRDQLRGDPERAARERAVRPREGRIHRRARAEARAHGAGRPAARCSWTRSER